MIIIVHGYGPTNVVEQNGYYDLRSRFTSLGISVVVWDKPGRGSSEGDFDINQPVESSAEEVVAAIRSLRNRGVSGSESIGLWGVSRAGWIAPLAISKARDIKFWISVSGTDALENWGYLLRSHLTIDGYSENQVNELYAMWIRGNEIFRHGGSYQEYLDATAALRQSSTYQRLTGRDFVDLERGGEEYELALADYVLSQENFIKEEHDFDPQTGLEVYVQNFDELLSSVDIPVLAIFGSNDRNVDWKRTKLLYESSIGENKKNQLTTRVFQDADHNIRVSESGSIFEMQQPDYRKTPYADGYYAAMMDWLCANGFCRTGRP